MNKKIFFSLVAMATMTLAGMTSCSNDDAIEVAGMPTAENTVKDAGSFGGISFGVTQNGALAGTRGIATTAANYLSRINDFQVIAFFNDGSGRYVGTADNAGTFIDGDGAGNWTYRNSNAVQFWPANTLDFQAVTPAEDASFTLSNTPDAGHPQLVANVTVPENVADQKDIMFASVENINNASSGNKVPLTFKHALSQVVFKGKVTTEAIKVDIAEIKICNIYGTGTVGFNTYPTLSAQGTGATTAGFAAGLIATPTVNTTEAINLTADNGALMMIPQERVAWKHAAPEKAISAATGAYMKITCTVEDTNSHTKLIDNDAVYIPLDLSGAKKWEMGKKYTYTLIFGNGSGGYDENGDPDARVVPIMYTVTAADNWEEVDGGNYGL